METGSRDVSPPGEESGTEDDVTAFQDAPLPPDSAPPTDAEPDAPAMCTSGPSSIGGGSGGGCSTNVTETCTNGVTYSADCKCANTGLGTKGTCSCSQMSGSSGAGSTGLVYDGCSSMCSDTSAAWGACSFPSPP